MHRLLLLVLALATLVSGQALQERTLRIQNAPTPADFTEISLSVISVSGTQAVSSDAEARQFSVRGTDTQLQAAQWALAELDRAASAAPPVTKRFTLDGKDEANVISVFYLSPSLSAQSFNELQTAIRTMTDLRYVGPAVQRHALGLRGTAEQLDFAAWLLAQPSAQPASYVFPQRGDAKEQARIERGEFDNQVRVFRYLHAPDVQRFNEFQTLVRTITDIRRVYPFIEQRTIFLRATPDQVPMAMWLSAQLDKDLPAATKSISPAYTTADGDLVRIFHFDGTTTQAAFRDRATALRTATGIRRFYPFESGRAIAARGTPAQIAQLESLFQQ
jgi:hypothetical protein